MSVVDLLADHMANPRNVGTVSDGARGRAILNQVNTGDALSLSIKIEGSRIMQARFRSFGNPVLRACASFVTQVVTSQEVTAIPDILPLEVARTLRVPPQHQYCVQMVMVALLQAVQDYRRRYGPLYGGAIQ